MSIKKIHNVGTNTNKWDFWIDRGGTFTDIIAKGPDKDFIVKKLLSANPKEYEDSTLEGIRRILNLKKNQPIPKSKINSIKIGTTIATNTLLERKGNPTVLVITKGFKDLLKIKNQNREDLFKLNISSKEILHSETIEINERLLSNGEVEKEIDLDDTRIKLKNAFDRGFTSIAIVLMHSYQFPHHELLIEKLAKDIGFISISVSHKITSTIKIIGRAETTVANAYLSNGVNQYIQKVSFSERKNKTLIMQSNGGLLNSKNIKAIDTILSGPAGGVIGMVQIAKETSNKKVIGFDMGGTSTDISLFDNAFEQTFETILSGIRIRTPMLKVHTIAAGGGSICRFDGLRLSTGPDSAGANPGPMSYRNHGPLTITDCNLYLGRIIPKYFPKVFGDSGSKSLDKGKVKNFILKLFNEKKNLLADIKSPEELANSFLEVSNEKMANAIKTMSVDKGYNLKEYSIISFGGAAGQHICSVANNVGINKILIHPFSSVLSAYGIGVAKTKVSKEKTVSLELNSKNIKKIYYHFKELTELTTKEFKIEETEYKNYSIIKKIYLKYKDSDNPIEVEYLDQINMLDIFHRKHKKVFGFSEREKKIVTERIFVEVIEEKENAKLNDCSKSQKRHAPEITEVTSVWSEGQWIDLPVFHRSKLKREFYYDKECMIIEKKSIIFVEKGWTVELDDKLNIILNNKKLKSKKNINSDYPSHLYLEIFNNHYMSIAERMGKTLQLTAHSVNIKERLDFSCAIFDSSGNLIANAPHMPVHLGSMSDSVKVIIEKFRNNMNAEDAYATNAPYNGGTHLPDITVVMPVYCSQSGFPDFFVANRGHHADVGGITPGSMPPLSKNINEEGVLIDAMQILDKKRFLKNKILNILHSGNNPARNVNQNLSDLQAQIASCITGRNEIKNMCKQFGVSNTINYSQFVQDNAEMIVRNVINNISDGEFRAFMDDGKFIDVSIKVNKETSSAIIDFSKSSQQVENNFNAPISVTKAAVLYVFRTLVNDYIPLNEGCLRPLKIILQKNSILFPSFPGAVAAGNVETSQIICDALFGALGTLAASQGTMNNLTFGNNNYQYYETICGGTGAGKGFKGADAVQSHMTNSRITDPEILETRYPVLLEEFGIREFSGGEGMFNGGNGVKRSIRFLEKMIVAILSGRRKTSPFGIKGGGSAKPGETKIKKTNGEIKVLSSVDIEEVNKGDIIIVNTPGGGGYGNKT